MKLEIHYKKKTEKHANTGKLDNMLLNKKQINNYIKEKFFKKYLEVNKKEIIGSKESIRHSQKSCKRKIHSNRSLPQDTRKISINNLTLHLKELEKENKKSQNEQKERSNKDQSGNKIKPKKNNRKGQ